jgi:DNA-binding response OmpR family regulator
MSTPLLTVLLLEDEAPIREVERLYLEKAGFKVHEATDGEEALEIWNGQKPDIVVLDLNVPGPDGIEVCRTIRAESSVPIIMVTARVEETDELLGLEIGADDYLKKPFSPSVLVARVRTLLRRTVTPSRQVIGEVTIDADHQMVHYSGGVAALSTVPFRILQALTQQPGKIYTRSELLDTVYGEGAGDVYDRTIDAHIHAIRTALQDTAKPGRYVQTVIGRGYRFAVPS